MIDLTRRKLLIGAAGLITAPAIARAASLMPVKTVREDWLPCYGQEVSTRVYRELFKAIGHTFGGSGVVFRLPDLSGRMSGCSISTHRPPHFWALERHDIATSDRPNGIPAGFMVPVFSGVPA